MYPSLPDQWFPVDRNPATRLCLSLQEMSDTLLYERLKSGPFFIAGPCVIENETLLETVATQLKEMESRLGICIVFKASFDKANRTSVQSYRGPGIEKGMEMLAATKAKFSLPITTDVHESHQIEKVAEVADIIQIPAFLCRQTDLLLNAGRSGRIVNIKKAQFLSGMDMRYPVDKVLSTGNNQIMLTERGSMFGYNNLVVDFRNIPDMKRLGFPVVMDCTHSVQRPGGLEGKTGGNREFIPNMALAAKAFGADGYFFETHPRPDEGLSDGPNMLPLSEAENFIQTLIR